MLNRIQHEATPSYDRTQRKVPSVATFISQVAFDLGVDKKTACANAMELLGLSRWVREALLYRVLQELFPDQIILREASPQWLGRMRLDM